MGLFTLFNNSEFDKYNNLLNAGKIYVKDVNISLPRNFETGLVTKFNDYTK